MTIPEQIAQLKEQQRQLVYQTRQKKLEQIQQREQEKKQEREWWKSLDWTKTNIVLSRETGHSHFKVRAWRIRLGKPKVTKYWPICQQWDWSKSNSELAMELGINPALICGLRTKHGMPKSDHREPSDGSPFKGVVVPRSRSLIDWSSIDWEKNNLMLAGELGVTRELIRQHRLSLRKGKSKFHGMNRNFYDFSKLFAGIEKLTLAEARERMPTICEESFRKYCAALKIAVPPKSDPRTRHAWHLVDFRLPNLILSEIWNIHPQAIATHRSRHINDRPVFRSVRGTIPDEFKAMVEAERVKASEWFAKQNGQHQPEPVAA